MEGSAERFPLVLDLKTEEPRDAEGMLQRGPSVDRARLAADLQRISQAIAPVLATSEPSAGFGLQSIELSLTIGAEGGVWFVAKGSAVPRSLLPR